MNERDLGRSDIEDRIEPLLLSYRKNVTREREDAGQNTDIDRRESASIQAVFASDGIEKFKNAYGRSEKHQMVYYQEHSDDWVDKLVARVRDELQDS